VITYAYWALVVGLAIAVIVLLGVKMGALKSALLGALAILLVGWGTYYFYLQQIFVKRWGGVMTISVPEGQYHIATTWKDDNLWVENYDPKTNTCVFSEYSRGNLLEGRVTIKNCNPLAARHAGDVAMPRSGGKEQAAAGGSAPGAVAGGQ
jgi:energy-coupling factor transporter transmembrane protein EcfT